MPIKPDRDKLYPGGSSRSPEWQAIRETVKQRAGNKCERCGVKNHAIGGRDPSGKFHRAQPSGQGSLRMHWPELGTYGWCTGWRSGPLRIIKIVCTVGHESHDESCTDLEQLKFWCQRCHLAHDQKHHTANAKRSRRDALTKAGQRELKL